MKHKIYKISGACYASLGQLDAAVKSYKKVIAINPDYAEAHNNKILSVIYLFTNGQIPNALDTVEALVKDYPNEALL